MNYPVYFQGYQNPKDSNDYRNQLQILSSKSEGFEFLSVAI